jgi:hypothetical protein
MNFIININKDKTKEFKNIFEMTNSSCTYGFSFNFLKVMLYFSQPFIENMEIINEKITKVNISKIILKQGFFLNEDNIVTSSSSTAMDEEK